MKYIFPKSNVFNVYCMPDIMLGTVDFRMRKMDMVSFFKRREYHIF